MPYCRAGGGGGRLVLLVGRAPVGAVHRRKGRLIVLPFVAVFLIGLLVCLLNC